VIGGLQWAIGPACRAAERPQERRDAQPEDGEEAQDVVQPGVLAHAERMPTGTATTTAIMISRMASSTDTSSRRSSSLITGSLVAKELPRSRGEATDEFAVLLYERLVESQIVAHQGSGLVRRVDVSDLAGRLVHSEVAGVTLSPMKIPVMTRKMTTTLRRARRAMYCCTACFPVAVDDQR